MIDNIDVAILTKVNELAERRGLKPSDFVASVYNGEELEDNSLRFEVPPSGNALKVERFGKMLEDLGVGSDSNTLKGTAGSIIDALDYALSISPKPRTR